MKKETPRFSILALTLFFCTLLFMQMSATASSSEFPEDPRQLLFENGVKMHNDILASLPASKTYKPNFYTRTMGIEHHNIIHPDIYSGYAVKGDKLILNLTKSSKNPENADQLATARKIAKKHHAAKIHYVNYSLNELYALCGKVSYYMRHKTELEINLTALDDANGAIVVSFEKLTERKVENAKKIFGDSPIIEYVEATGYSEELPTETIQER